MARSQSRQSEVENQPVEAPEADEKLAQVMGNLGGDPTVRKTTRNTPVVNFSVAVNDRNDPNAKPEWHQVVMFGKVAEEAAKSLRKGSSVLVKGEIRVKTYEQDGEVKQSTELAAKSLSVFEKDGPTRTFEVGAPRTSQSQGVER